MKLSLHPEAAQAAVRAQAPMAVQAAADVLLSVSREQCPVDSGYLRASGEVSQDGLTARVSYSAPYAAIVHETQEKFLENPLNDPGVQAGILTRLAGAIRL